MKINPVAVLIALSISALPTSSAFNVDRAIRHSNKVEEYTPADRTWRFPEASKIRHSDGLSPHLSAEDRTWWYSEDTPKKIRLSNGPAATLQPNERAWRKPSSKAVSTDNSVARQVYTDSDRAEWTTPDTHHIRHTNVVPKMDSEDRLWRLHP